MNLYLIKEQYSSISQKFESVKKMFDVEKAKSEVIKLENIMTEPGFWDKHDYVAKITSKLSFVKERVKLYIDGQNAIESVKLTFELLDEIEDEELFSQLENDINDLNNIIVNIYNKFLLSDEKDSMDVIVDIHSGAGGTEAQDWVEMIYRMYTRYCSSLGLSLNVLSYHHGDMAGIKSVSFEVKGTDAYGMLKSEKGVHRLVRISPFDSSGKRHTSFASVDIVPLLDEIDDIDIDKSDIKIDTYRSSGAGGQSINTTDSAVRITHLESGIVVSCQNERSQIKNRETALKVLKIKLKTLEEDKRKREQNSELKSEIGWGSQIRSYVFQPYTMVKDHRTNYENTNVKSVMDGEIEGFVFSYLEYVNKER